MTKKTYQNRIVGSGTANPADLVPNQKNWRRHPAQQQKAMTQVLETVGWVQDVIVNVKTGRLIDGHLRVEAAVKNGETSIPVKYVELTEDEERIALATFDPVGALAETDAELLAELQAAVETDFDFEVFAKDSTVGGGHCESTEARETLPETEKEYDESVADSVKIVKCPKCGYDIPV